MVSTSDASAASRNAAARQGKQRSARLVGLDGIRGLAALFVVFHHIWLLCFPGYPADNGPSWASPFLYGHFAVAVFIVLSGFSLAVAPARAGWHLKSKREFFFRRAWRILPTYWPALVFSLIIAWTIVPQPGEAAPTAKSVVVNGLLVQDITGAPTPNGAFWSIPVEAQLYLFFPLLILVVSRFGRIAMLTGVAATVVAVGALAPSISAVDKLMRFTPQFALLFALGAAAAGVVNSRSKHTSLLPWLTLGCLIPVAALIAVQGSVWTVDNFFWVDLALGPAIALGVASVAARRPAPVVRVLDTRPVRSLGSFSYSLYLIHAPIVVVCYQAVGDWLGHGVPAFLAMIAIAVPISVVSARLFAAAFEFPFTRNKSWSALRAAMRARWAVVRTAPRPRPATALPAENVVPADG